MQDRQKKRFIFPHFLFVFDLFFLQEHELGYSVLIFYFQNTGSDLMERYRELNKDKERLQRWRQNHIDIKDSFIQTTARLTHRRRQLISELNLIYPLDQVCY